jgi:adenine-specific DNA-methyltransferase
MLAPDDAAGDRCLAVPTYGPRLPGAVCRPGYGVESMSPSTTIRRPARPGGDPRSLAGRPPEPRGLLGQVLTPPKIALEMAASLLEDRPPGPLTVLDPCVGPGTFFTALAATGRLDPSDRLVGVDIDPEMIEEARRTVGVETHLADFLRWDDDRRFDAAILNPPYVRQEWLDDKTALIARLEAETGARIPGGANLYVYFLVRTVSMLAPGGRFSAIVYDSWQHTRYGSWLRGFLELRCGALGYKRVERTPFRGRLIDATIIHGTRSDGPVRRRARPTEVCTPLSGVQGMRPVDDLYLTRRGLRLKQAGFFLCSPADGARLDATRFVKRIRHVGGYAVSRDHPEAALLVKAGDLNHPAVAELRRRLRDAGAKPEENVSILTWAKERPDRWYSHAPPPRAPILVNYFLRGRPRHLLNPDLAYSDNFYGLAPRAPHDGHALLALLNATATTIGILAQSRNQGAGLRKVQLFEYRTAMTPDPSAFAGRDMAALSALGRELALGRPPDQALLRIDDLVASCLGARELRPSSLRESLAAHFRS